MYSSHIPNELLKLEIDTWTRLHQANHHHGTAFYTGVMGTSTPSGISMRTVVIREALPDTKELICYSDLRANKVQEIQKNPMTAWLFYDAQTQLQFRLSGTTIIHANDELAKLHWQRTHSGNRKNYLTGQAPGTLIPNASSGLPNDWATREITDEESETGWPNFAVIRCQVHSIDWLQLAKTGNRRAQFDYKAAKLTDARWVVP